MPSPGTFLFNTLFQSPPERLQHDLSHVHSFGGGQQLPNQLLQLPKLRLYGCLSAALGISTLIWEILDETKSHRATRRWSKVLMY